MTKLTHDLGGVRPARRNKNGWCLTVMVDSGTQRVMFDDGQFGWLMMNTDMLDN